MSRKYCFLLFARNKASEVQKTIDGVLNQSARGFEIVLSDQGSTDGTTEILKRAYENYDGPNKIRFLQCPETEYRGMAGLNAHFNWLHQQMDADVIVSTPADDLPYSNRMEETMRAWEEHNPSFLATGMHSKTIDGTVLGYTGFPQESRFVTPAEQVLYFVGSSGSQAWAYDLYDKYGPLRTIESEDLIIPFFATLERGLYFHNVPCHAYVQHADMDNTGTEGILRACKTPEEKSKWGEVNCFHVIANFQFIMRRLGETQQQIPVDCLQALHKQIVEQSFRWVVARESLTMGRIQPEGFKV